MEVYRRITERVRGALWAHHGRLMPERQFHRILAYVYNNKYEYQIRLDKMKVVGKAWDGRVEVETTPAGFLKKTRVNCEVLRLTTYQQQQLILIAYAEACQRGREVMEKAELQIYKQFLLDLKPIVMGIRDNCEFYTVPEDSIETIGGTLINNNNNNIIHRTIPAAKAYQPQDEIKAREQYETKWFNTSQGQAWARSIKGKTYLSLHASHYKPRGAPGNKKKFIIPLDLPAPYTKMDEERLIKKNWMYYLDNKHVAEVMWTKSKIADREKQKRILQERGQAWHRPINEEAITRW